MSVIIVGGGMAGATLALALSRLTQGQVSIDLIEAIVPENQQHPGFDARSIALAQGTRQQLARLNIWPTLSDSVTPIKHIHVSDRGHSGTVNLSVDDYGITALGYVLELHQAGKRLFSLLKSAPGVTLHCPAKVVDVSRSVQHASVVLDSGKCLQGQLLIAADGTYSALAKACQIQWQCRDYQQMAVIANITTAEHHQGRAFERFTSTGPLALLPMSEGRSALVWCQARADQDKVEQWSDDVFLQQLQRAFGWRLGQMLKTGRREIYPLRQISAGSQISHRLALVGNAAQTLHPIAGQGFNLGMRDVVTLAETLAEAVHSGHDLGAYPVLMCYQQRRRYDRTTTMGLTDSLVHLFANQHVPLVAGRNIGMTLMEHLPLLRMTLAQRTLGWVAR